MRQMTQEEMNEEAREAGGHPTKATKIDEILEELETLTSDDYQTDYYPVSPQWLREKFQAYTVTLGREMEGMRRKSIIYMTPEEVVADALKFKRHPNQAFNDGHATGYNQAITACQALLTNHEGE